MSEPKTRPEKDRRHPQIFRDDAAEQRIIDSVDGHWLGYFVARLVRIFQKICNKKR
jgi:hypothetical protein